MHSYLAEQALQARDFKSAVTHYDAALAVQPDNPAALNNLAWVLGELGDVRAVEIAERAVRLAPANPDFKDTLGGLLVARGDTAVHWRLRGAVERMRQRTGADLVRQVIPLLDWRYDERPSEAADADAWEAGLAMEAGDAIALGHAVVDLGGA